MRIYLADEKCRECKGKRARLIQVVERGSNVGAATYEDCPRCSGVGLEPRELSHFRDRTDLLWVNRGTHRPDYRNENDPILEHYELVYRMEEAT